MLLQDLMVRGGCVHLNDSIGHEIDVVSLKPLFAKGEKKQNINRRLVDSLSGSVKDVRVELQKALKVVEAKGGRGAPRRTRRGACVGGCR